MSWRGISISRSPSPRGNYSRSVSIQRSPQRSPRRPRDSYSRNASPQRSPQRMQRWGISPSLRRSPALKQRGKSPFLAISRSPERKRVSLSPEHKQRLSPIRRLSSHSPDRKRESRSPRSTKNKSPRRRGQSVSPSRGGSQSPERNRKSSARRRRRRSSGRKRRSRKKRSKRSARRAQSSSSSSESRSPRRSGRSYMRRWHKRYHDRGSSTSSSTSCRSIRGRRRRRGHGEMFRIIEMKLRQDPLAVVPGRIADIRNIGYDSGVLQPDIRRIQEYFSQEDLRLTQSRAEIDRELLELRAQQTKWNVPIYSSKAKFSELYPPPCKTKEQLLRSPSKVSLKHTNAECDNKLYFGTVAATGGSKNGVHPLPYLSAPKPYGPQFIAEFARHCFDLSQEYQMSKEKCGNKNINKAPQLGARRYDGGIQINQDDTGEEKELHSNKVKTKFSNHEKRTNEALPKRKYPKANFLAGRRDELPPMNISMDPDNPRTRKPYACCRNPGFVMTITGP